MLLLVLFLIFGTLWILNIYTNHGQQLELPDYVGLEIDIADLDADKNSFEIIVDDSLHKINTQGGIILHQNPPAGSMVKENRKIYVTISKYEADFILSEHLPPLYGMDFEMKKRELEGQQIFSTIKDTQYDNAAPNTILEVWYDNQLIVNRNEPRKNIKIEKGKTLEFVVSKNYGGQVTIPDVSCLELSAARFTIENSSLLIGELHTDDSVTDLESAYVTRQVPSASALQKIDMTSPIDLYLTQEKPNNCR